MVPSGVASENPPAALDVVAGVLAQQPPVLICPVASRDSWVPSLLALVACTVAVRDLTATKNLLQNNEVPLQQASHGDVFGPATAGLGVTIAFRQANQPANTTATI
jgi:hypothetical protein